jgi:DNA-directed RNA polymerase subunit M/transcription elongation factor TFIIS
MTPPRLDAACDFCSRRFRGLWVIECGPIRISGLNPATGKFALVLDCEPQPVGACPDCFAFLEAGDAQGLTRFAAEHIGNANNSLVATYHREVIRARLGPARYKLARDREEGPRFFEHACPRCGHKRTEDAAQMVDEKIETRCPKCGQEMLLIGKPHAKGTRA